MRVVIGDHNIRRRSAKIARPARVLWRQLQSNDFEQIDTLVVAVRVSQDTAKADAEDGKPPPSRTAFYIRRRTALWRTKGRELIARQTPPLHLAFKMLRNLSE